MNQLQKLTERVTKENIMYSYNTNVNCKLYETPWIALKHSLNEELLVVWCDMTDSGRDIFSVFAGDRDLGCYVADSLEEAAIKAAEKWLGIKIFEVIDV
jgi:hypothetical protein